MLDINYIKNDAVNIAEGEKNIERKKELVKTLFQNEIIENIPQLRKYFRTVGFYGKKRDMFVICPTKNRLNYKSFYLNFKNIERISYIDRDETHNIDKEFLIDYRLEEKNVKETIKNILTEFLRDVFYILELEKNKVEKAMEIDDKEN